MLLSVCFLTQAFVCPSIRFTCFQVQLFLHDQYYYFMTLEVTEFKSVMKMTCHPPLNKKQENIAPSTAQAW